MLALHNKNIENISMFTLKLFTSSDYHLHFTLTGYRLSTAGHTSLFRVEPRGRLDGSWICRGRTDGMSGRGPSAAHAGTGSWEAPGVAGASRHPRRHGTALECVAVGPRACFPGGPAVPRFSLFPGLPATLSRGSRCVCLSPLPGLSPGRRR